MSRPLTNDMCPEVSVVIPTFNRSRLLVRAIESVLSQTWTDYELIVIDDGSTDDTRTILKPYMDRIRYVYQKNRGASAAQNKGIDIAQGKWVGILASDDKWLPTKLAGQLTALRALGDDFGACYTDCIYERSASAQVSAFTEAGVKPAGEFGPDYDPLRHVLGKAVIWVQSLLVQRSLLQEINGFDERLLVQEDTDLVIRLAGKTRFCFVAKPLVEIDQSSSFVHLTDRAFSRGEQRYAAQEYMYRKWLAMPQLKDIRIRAKTECNLRSLYHSWTAARIQRLDFAGALVNVKQLKTMGGGYRETTKTLLLRAAGRLFRRMQRYAA